MGRRVTLLWIRIRGSIARLFVTNIDNCRLKRKYVLFSIIWPLDSLGISIFTQIWLKFLINKINHLAGICRITVTGWFQSYLFNRYQTVRAVLRSPDFLLVTSGVPQGSQLGPLLLMYICVNDVPKCYEFSKFLYTDDHKIFRSMSNTRDAEVIQDLIIKKILLWK